MHLALQLSSLLVLLSSSSLASGFYSKSSPVLQVDAKNYEKLIAKSNYTSIVEFYAPWCGHCQSLKPAYEKAASSLLGYAKVAAINCDDDANKPFCGSMGVQGFPTLKIVKPSKKAGGRPLVEDYNGPRTAKAINEVVKDKIPNHVARPNDAELDAWLKKTERPKAIFFTDKALVSPMVKALAIDFLGAIDVAQVKSSETEAVSRFKVESFPQAYVISGADKAPEKYDGELKKAPLKDFFSKYAAPNPEFPAPSPAGKASGDKKDTKAKPKASAKKSGGGEASCPAGHTGKNPHTAASETIKDDSNPTESPSPKVASESPAPVHVPVEAAPPLASLESEDALAKSCLGKKLGTCVLAVLSASAGDDTSDLDGLKEIAHKHALRRSKLFPFYAVPSTNAAGQALVSTLGAKPAGDRQTVLLAVNPKKNWWVQYSGPNLGKEAVEIWIDNIRFGEFKKEKLPDGVAKEAQETAGKAPKESVTEGKAADDHDEL